MVAYDFILPNLEKKCCNFHKINQWIPHRYSFGGLSSWSRKLLHMHTTVSWHTRSTKRGPTCVRVVHARRLTWPKLELCLSMSGRRAKATSEEVAETSSASFLPKTPLSYSTSELFPTPSDVNRTPMDYFRTNGNGMQVSRGKVSQQVVCTCLVPRLIAFYTLCCLLFRRLNASWRWTSPSPASAHRDGESAPLAPASVKS